MEEFLHPDHLQEALARRAAHQVMMVFQMHKDSKASTSQKQNDLFAIEVKNMTRMHLIYKMYELGRANLESSIAGSSNLK